MDAVVLAEEARQLARLETDPHKEALATWLGGKTASTQQSYTAAHRITSPSPMASTPEA